MKIVITLVFSKVMKPNLKSVYLVVCMGLVLGVMSCSSKKTATEADHQESTLGPPQSEADKCYATAKGQSQPGELAESGYVDMSVSISPEGKVIDAHVLQNSTGSKKLSDCLSEMIRRAKFAKPEGGRIHQFTRTYRFGSA